MEIRRVAVIYDDKDRPETTGVYCQRALGSMIEAVHFRAGDLAGIPRTGFDLYLNIDDGLEYQLPDGLRPAAWWAIDTHLNFEWCRRKAKAFDFVFAAQRDGAARLVAEGIAAAQWLPLACDADVHGRIEEVEKVHEQDATERRPHNKAGYGVPGNEDVDAERLGRRGPDGFDLGGHRRGRLVACGQEAERPGPGGRDHQVGRRGAAGHRRHDDPAPQQIQEPVRRR